MHRGHVSLGVKIRDEVLGDDAWLVYVPAAGNPLKPGGPIATAADRVRMLEIANEDEPRTAVWTDEIDRAGDGEASFWVETVERAAEVSGLGGGDEKPRFLIGADSAVSFHRWRSYERILEVAEPVVMVRPPLVTADAVVGALRETGAWTAEELAWWHDRVVETRPVASSSTVARTRIGGVDLDLNVSAYISARGLYRRLHEEKGGEPRCANCGYDLSDVGADAVCPECGITKAGWIRRV